MDQCPHIAVAKVVDLVSFGFYSAIFVSGFVFEAAESQQYLWNDKILVSSLETPGYILV